MRTFLLFLLAFLPICLTAQYYDDFADGDFTTNPVWSGDVAKFIVQNNRLCLNDLSASGTALKAYLSTPSQAYDSATYICQIEVKAAVTSANYVRFYLTADTADLTAPLNGYFILVGGTAKSVCLYRQQGTTTTKIIDGTANRLTSSTLNQIEVKATHENGQWVLSSRLPSETDFQSEGTTTDNTVKGATHSGIYVYYSSGNKDKYSFGLFDVTGRPYVALEQNIALNDIVINEIMADPDPVVALPNAEYIELYNRRNRDFDLAGFKLTQGTRTGTINSGILPANGYLILCPSANRTDFEAYGAVASITSFPTLTNASGLVTLLTPNDRLICRLEYSDAWYDNDAFKKDGGWSLERIDADNFMNNSTNFQPSHDNAGGTPGRVNSVAGENRDASQPEILGVAYENDAQFTILFSKSMNDSTLQTLSNYVPDLGSITSAAAAYPLSNAVTLTLNSALSEGEIRHVTLSDLKCVAGFPLEAVVTLALPETIEPMDVVINEVLFNAPTDGTTYVELFNASDKMLDLSTLFLTRRRDGALDARKTITEKRLLIAPKRFIVLSADSALVCRHYGCADDALYIAMTLPSTPNAEGNLTLILSDGRVIDEFSYSEKMHHTFVSNYRGVALERVNPYTATQSDGNWHSAAADVGYGTPGRQNSQYRSMTEEESTKTFWLDYATFTPDNDSYRDQLFLNYRLDKSGYMLNLTIYDPSGLRVRRLCNNTLLGLEGTIVWDGTKDSGALVPIGVYVMLVEAVHPDGNRKREKVVCVVGGR